MGGSSASRATHAIHPNCPMPGRQMTESRPLGLVVSGADRSRRTEDAPDQGRAGIEISRVRMGIEVNIVDLWIWRPSIEKGLSTGVWRSAMESALNAVRRYAHGGQGGGVEIARERGGLIGSIASDPAPRW